MPFSIYDYSVPVYVRRLTALSAILDKAAAYATERKIEPATLINARLYPDMFPLYRQVQSACNHAVRGVARLTGQEPAAVPDKRDSFDDLKNAIAETIKVLEKADKKKCDGMDEKQITFPMGDQTRTLSGREYLLHLSMPNFYFHLTTAYDILRHNGLNIGKGDFIGSD